MSALVTDSRTWEKFSKEGWSRRHPGSTFVSALKEGSPFYELGIRIQEDIRANGWAQDFGLTVPSSFHMTVLEGLKDPALVGQDAKWPQWLSDAVDFPDAVMRMRERLALADISGPASLDMRCVGVHPLSERLTFELVPASRTVHTELDRFRREAGNALEIPVQSLDEYKFHITLGYRLTRVDGNKEALDEKRELYNSWIAQTPEPELEQVGFCIFNDMQSFPPLLYFS